ncbi:MAG: hypothetical protein ABI412_04820 [Sphingomicrobium sp.]
MKTFAFAAGALALAITAPAGAKPHHDKHHGHHRSHGQQVLGWGNGACPPGLAKKNNGCLPPGIAKKRYNVGQRWQSNYGQQWTYSQIPYDWRNQYGLNSTNRYYYRDGYLYRVDPRTQLVEQVIRALIR